MVVRDGGSRPCLSSCTQTSLELVRLNRRIVDEVCVALLRTLPSHALLISSNSCLSPSEVLAYKARIIYDISLAYVSFIVKFFCWPSLWSTVYFGASLKPGLTGWVAAGRLSHIQWQGVTVHLLNISMPLCNVCIQSSLEDKISTWWKGEQYLLVSLKNSEWLTWHAGIGDQQGWSPGWGRSIVVLAYPGCPGEEAIKWVDFCLNLFCVVTTHTVIA